ARVCNFSFLFPLLLPFPLFPLRAVTARTTTIAPFRRGSPSAGVLGPYSGVSAKLSYLKRSFVAGEEWVKEFICQRSTLPGHFFDDRYCHYSKVREAQLAQYNFILVVGEEEANTGQEDNGQEEETKKLKVIQCMFMMALYFTLLVTIVLMD
ncbi:uncharacterized protein LOC120256138, partial [Dioscorea cayenensis subsp. rotundata]|uniref:Uncharacterized protein LOC120256138 n=1 Tax=Dioscorea cayennensis subsp. rotundata TaxID=55577 RepID=A0AB40AXQ3_DIOCR